MCKPACVRGTTWFNTILSSRDKNSVQDKFTLAIKISLRKKWRSLYYTTTVKRGYPFFSLFKEQYIFHCSRAAVIASVFQTVLAVMHLSYDCNFSLLMHFCLDRRRVWEFQSSLMLSSGFPYFSNPGFCQALESLYYSTTCIDFLWSQFVSKCLHPLLFLWDVELYPFMLITEQQSFDKSKFERTILVEACCYQSPGPFLFCKSKNKVIVSELFFLSHCSDGRSLAHWLLFTVFLATVHWAAGWKTDLLLSTYHSWICFYIGSNNLAVISSFPMFS